MLPVLIWSLYTTMNVLKGLNRKINIAKKLHIACMRITVLSIQSIALQFWGRIQCNFETDTENGTIIWLFASEDNRHCSLVRDVTGYEPYWAFVEFYCEKSSTSFQLVGMFCLFCPTCICMIIKLENMPFFHFVYCQHIVHCVVKMAILRHVINI